MDEWWKTEENMRPKCVNGLRNECPDWRKNAWLRSTHSFHWPVEAAAVAQMRQTNLALNLSSSWFTGWHWTNHSCHLSLSVFIWDGNSSPYTEEVLKPGGARLGLLSTSMSRVSGHRNRPRWLRRTASSAASCTTWRRVAKDGTRHGSWSLKMNLWCCISTEPLRYASYSFGSFQPPGKARVPPYLQSLTSPWLWKIRWDYL